MERPGAGGRETLDEQLDVGTVHFGFLAWTRNRGIDAGAEGEGSKDMTYRTHARKKTPETSFTP